MERGLLDTDNLANSFKAVQDAIAKRMGIDDGDQSKVHWVYEQRATGKREYGLEVKIEAAEVAAGNSEGGDHMSAVIKASEKQIIFGADSVRAILAGLKVQTRRVNGLDVINKSTSGAAGFRYDGLNVNDDHLFFDVYGNISGHDPQDCMSIVKCPYGKPKGRLWVREALFETGGEWFYGADKLPVELDADNPHVPAMVSWAFHNDRDTCNPMYMPRWASRITLEITNIRVERLQDMTVLDCEAEGVFNEGDHQCLLNQFEDGWDALNAKRGYSWESNPWVWVIEFKRLEVEAAEAVA